MAAAGDHRAARLTPRRSCSVSAERRSALTQHDAGRRRPARCDPTEEVVGHRHDLDRGVRPVGGAASGTAAGGANWSCSGTSEQLRAVVGRRRSAVGRRHRAAAGRRANQPARRGSATCERHVARRTSSRRAAAARRRRTARRRRWRRPRRAARSRRRRARRRSARRRGSRSGPRRRPRRQGRGTARVDHVLRMSPPCSGWGWRDDRGGPRRGGHDGVGLEHDAVDGRRGSAIGVVGHGARRYRRADARSRRRRQAADQDAERPHAGAASRPRTASGGRRAASSSRPPPRWPSGWCGPRSWRSARTCAPWSSATRCCSTPRTATRSRSGRGLHHPPRARHPRRRRRAPREAAPACTCEAEPRCDRSWRRARSMTAMPGSTPIAATAEQLAAVTLQRRRPGARHRAGDGHRRGADDGVDERRDAAPARCDEGRTVFWSRSRQEVWRKGETSRRPPVRPRGVLRLRRRHAAVRGRAGGQGRLPHRRRTPASSARFGPTVSGLTHAGPSRDEFHALAAEHTVVPVWSELLADLETPVAAYAKLVGDGAGFLLESVEHGERWSRFVVRRPRPVGHARAARRRRSTVDGDAARRRPARPGHPRRARGAARTLPVARSSPTCRRCTAGRGLPRLRRRPRGRAPARRARTTTAACPTR